MANNDRVTRDPSPSWIPDNQSSGQYLATKKINGAIGWNNEDVTKNLLSRNSFNQPGWRDKIIIPPGMGIIEYDTALFEVQKSADSSPIQTGSMIPLGTQINIFLVSQLYNYGCRMEITNGSTLTQYFMKNFGEVSGRAAPNLIEDVTMIGNIQITGTSKRRAYISAGCDNPGTITAEISVTSWGDKGSQTKSNWALVQSWSDPSDLEFYVGDELHCTFTVNSAYHWANFRTGTDPENLYLVNKSLIVYPTGLNGGQYDLTAGIARTYLAMAAVKPVSFYLYQPGYSTFTRTKVKVSKLNSNLVIYKNVTQPSVGTEIDYGRNGVQRNHVPLYAGMQVEIYCTNSTYVSYYVVDYESLSPTVPAPTGFEYLSPCKVTIETNANTTGQMCVGLRYLKTNYYGNSVSSKLYTSDTDTFKNFMDNLYYMEEAGEPTSYFTNKLRRQWNANSPVSQETNALLLGFAENGAKYYWELEVQGTFQKGSLNSYYDGYIYPDDPGVLINNVFYNLMNASGVNLGPIGSSLFGYVRSTLTGGGGGEGTGTKCTIYCCSDAMNVDISAPNADWYVPDDPTRYIPLSTLQNLWGNNPWDCEIEFTVRPILLAVVGSA